jgi:transcriptional regulator with XRE-family HTH domain
MPFPKLPSFLTPFPSFGEQLHNYRTMRGMTVEELAKAVNVSPSAVFEFEKGTRPAPPKDVVAAMAEKLALTKGDRSMFLDAAELSSPFLHALTGKTRATPQAPEMTAAILVFLIADIRGYSRFTQEFGDQAAARLTTRFAEIARDAVEHWSGQLVEMRGDEALAAFASARQALHAAHMLQERCQEESAQHPDLPLAIGVGLDLGEVARVDGGYRGGGRQRPPPPGRHPRGGAGKV